MHLPRRYCGSCHFLLHTERLVKPWQQYTHVIVSYKIVKYIISFAVVTYFAFNICLLPLFVPSLYCRLWMTAPFRPHQSVDEIRFESRRVMSTNAMLAKELREAEEEESRRSERATFIKSHIHFNNVTASRGISRASDVAGSVAGLRYGSNSSNSGLRYGNNGSFTNSSSSIHSSSGIKPNAAL